MHVITRIWQGVSRADEWRLVPLADVHLGAAACDETLFQETVQRIAADDRCLWIGLGDMLECINRSDKRFSMDEVAPWLQNRADMAGAQRDRFLDIVKPIAGKCLAMVRGNHEDLLLLRYERDVYAEMCTALKGWAGMKADDRLGVGMVGYVRLLFRRSEKRERGTTITISLHHGYTGGKLDGAKALDMQRWLWAHDCDLALMGHSHNTLTDKADAESVDKAGNVVEQTRRGAFCGTFLGTWDGNDTYAAKKGYFHSPVGTIEVLLRPGEMKQRDRVKLVV